ncbi:uncharacterized protein [Diadema setosum]|uniref:uncharacterized protein n=1 Tax=Diadema setosum TaxID=31175 RepID=UPI003B3AA932
MKLLVLTLSVLGVALGLPTDKVCNVIRLHAQLGSPTLGTIDENAISANHFELVLSDLDDGFLPEVEYDVITKGNGKPFQEFVVTAENTDSHCEHGELIDRYGVAKTNRTCPHMVKHSAPTDMQKVTLGWVAPQCGCVTFRATVKTNGHTFSESEKGRGFMTKQVCMAVTEDSREPAAEEEEQDATEEPLHNGEIYETIERFCEEGQQRGPKNAAIVQECCELAVHQRRICLTQKIPSAEDDLHRLGKFCSRMVGNFFDEHPLLASAVTVRRCCEIAGDVERLTCITEEKMAHYNEICAIKMTERNMTDGRQGKTCCHREGEDRYSCFERRNFNMPQKRREERLRQRMRALLETRLERICNFVERSTLPSARNRNYETCCEVERIDEALMCFKETQEDSFDRLCARTARGRGRAQRGNVHPCCGQNNVNRYKCFERRQPQKRIDPNDGNVTRPSNMSERRFSLIGRPTRMDRLCSQSNDTEVRSCCRKNKVLMKKKCFDDMKAKYVSRQCNGRSQEIAHSVNAAMEYSILRIELNPEHECCLVEGEERRRCIKGLQAMRTESNDGDATQQVERDSTSDRTGQKWMREESRQNEAICAMVNDNLAIADVRLVSCCGLDPEDQRNCLAGLRRSHFTSLCKDRNDDQIAIFTTILATEDQVDSTHRCCVRPNADIRAACFSRIERHVAMLAYSPPIVSEMDNLRTELLGVAELNRLDRVCEDLETATRFELRGRWPVKKCCRYRNYRRYTCILAEGKKMADKSCDGPRQRIYFPVGFYGEFISPEYNGPVLDSTHPCCRLSGEMRYDCIKDASYAVLTLRVPELDARPFAEFFQVMPAQSRFAYDHQSSVCTAAYDFQYFYDNLEDGLDVELDQPVLIESALQDIQDELDEEITDAEEDAAELQNSQGQEAEEEEEEEEEEDDDDDDRRRRRRSVKRPTELKVKQATGNIYGIDGLLACCDLENEAERQTCMTNLWLSELRETCLSLPDLPTPSESESESQSQLQSTLESTSTTSQSANMFLAPAPLRADTGVQEQTVSETDSQTGEEESDEERFRRCCSMSGSEQEYCFQNHYSPSAPSSQTDSSAASEGSQQDSSENPYNSEGSESDNESEDSENGEPEELEESESEDVDQDMEEEEEEEEIESEGGGPAGLVDITKNNQGLTTEDVDGSINQEPNEQMESGSEGQDIDGEEEESESEGLEGNGPQGQMESESEGQDVDGEEEEEEESESDGLGGNDPQGQMESESEGQDMDGEEEEEEESESDGLGGNDPQGQMESESEGQDMDGEEEEEEESESEGLGGNGPQGQMESESEGQDMDGEEEEEESESEGLGGNDPQGLIESESEGQDMDGEEEEEESESEGLGGNDPQGQMESESEGQDMDGEEEEEESESEGLGGNDPQGQIESESEGQDMDGEEEEEESESEGLGGPQGLIENESEGQDMDGEEEEESESEGLGRNDPQGQMESESEGQDMDWEEEEEESESEGLGGNGPQGQMESESESQDMAGEEEELESESEGSDSESPDTEEEESESESSNGQIPQGQSQGSESESQSGGFPFFNWWGNEEEEEEEEEDDRRRKRDIWAAAKLIEGLDEDDDQELSTRPNVHSPSRKTKNHERGHRGNRGKKRQNESNFLMYILKALINDDVFSKTCTHLTEADGLPEMINVITSLANYGMDSKGKTSKYKRRNGTSGNYENLIPEMTKCCALNETEGRVDCVTAIKETLIDGICDVQTSSSQGPQKENARRKKRQFLQCCGQADEERYSCFDDFFSTPLLDGQEEHETNGTTQSFGWFGWFSKAVGKFMAAIDDEETDQGVDEEPVEPTDAPEAEVEASTDVRGQLVRLACCTAGKASSTLIGSILTTTCEESSTTYAGLVAEEMAAECKEAYLSNVGQD